MFTHMKVLNLSRHLMSKKHNWSKSKATSAHNNFNLFQMTRDVQNAETMLEDCAL